MAAMKGGKFAWNDNDAWQPDASLQVLPNLRQILPMI
jgi:hypothetical protein